VYYKSQVIGYASEDRGKVHEFIAGMVLSEYHKRCEIVQTSRECAEDLGRYFLNKSIEKEVKDFRFVKKAYGSWSLISDDHAIDLSRVADFHRLQGLSYDLKVFDDAQDITEDYFRASLLWCRSFDKAVFDTVLAQAVLTMNIKKIKSFHWIYKYFEPWLSGKVPYGEVIPFATAKDGSTIFLDSMDVFVYKNGIKIYDFDPEDFDYSEFVHPQTRTFILE
jgi:hypothetical protein